MSIRTERPQAGVTLIELIVFIVIVSVGLTGVLASLNVSVKGSADPLQPKQALATAEAMLEEILIKEYSPPVGGYLAGCPTPCDRTQFDDVLDYAGYTSTGIKDVSGSNIAGLESYNVTSIAVTADSFCTNPTTSANEAYKVIVTVQAPSGTQYTLTGYRCKS